MTIYQIDCDIFKDRQLFRCVYKLLSQERREKIDMLALEEGKRTSLGAGFALYYALWMRHVDLSSAVIYHTEHRKPCLEEKTGLFFNLSHSGSRAVCVIGTAENGIDIQKEKPVSEGLLGRICSKEEYQYVIGLPKERRTGEICRIWAAKESYVKYTGAGLTCDLRSIVLFHQGQLVSSISRGDCRGNAAKICYMREYAQEDYHMAVCAEEALTDLKVERILREDIEAFVNRKDISSTGKTISLC